MVIIEIKNIFVLSLILLCAFSIIVHSWFPFSSLTDFYCIDRLLCLLCFGLWWFGSFSRCFYVSGNVYFKEYIQALYFSINIFNVPIFQEETFWYSFYPIQLQSHTPHKNEAVRLLLHSFCPSPTNSRVLLESFRVLIPLLFFSRFN